MDLGFPGGTSGKKKPTCRCRGQKRLGPDPWEAPLQEGTPVFLPGESPWTEEPGRLQSMG